MLSFPQRFDASRRKDRAKHMSDFVHFENPDFLNIVSYLKSQAALEMFGKRFGQFGIFDMLQP